MTDATRKNLLRIFVFGALLGAFFDGFHTHGGITSYPHPWLFRMAWWTLPLFGAAWAGIAGSHVLLDRELHRPPRPTPAWLVAAGLCYFGGCYYLSAFLPIGNLGKLGVLLLGWVVLFVLIDRTWQGAAQALLTAVCGCAVEMLLTRQGAFAHLTADFWGIPCWLPALYFLASLTIGNLGRRMLAAEPCHAEEPGAGEAAALG